MGAAADEDFQEPPRPAGAQEHVNGERLPLEAVPVVQLRRQAVGVVAVPGLLAALRLHGHFQRAPGHGVAGGTGGLHDPPARRGDRAGRPGLPLPRPTLPRRALLVVEAREVDLVTVVKIVHPAVVLGPPQHVHPVPCGLVQLAVHRPGILTKRRVHVHRQRISLIAVGVIRAGLGLQRQSPRRPGGPAEKQAGRGQAPRGIQYLPTGQPRRDMIVTHSRSPTIACRRQHSTHDSRLPGERAV